MSGRQPHSPLSRVINIIIINALHIDNSQDSALGSIFDNW
jgi:hypothetical protein